MGHQEPCLSQAKLQILYLLVPPMSQAVVKKFRDYDKALEFVKACPIPGPTTKDPTEDHDEVPLNEADWTPRSVKDHDQAVEFVKIRCAPKLNDTSTWSHHGADERPDTAPEWYTTIANGWKAWTFGICSSLGKKLPSFPWESSWRLQELSCLMKFKTQGAALALLEHNHQLVDQENKVAISPADSRPKLVKDTAKTTMGTYNFLPRMGFTGPDPSATKRHAVFGVDVGSDKMDLRSALLLPPATCLMEFRKVWLANSMVDVIGIPGGFYGGSDEGNGNEMALLGVAMEELVSQGQSHIQGLLVVVDAVSVSNLCYTKSLQ